MAQMSGCEPRAAYHIQSISKAKTSHEAKPTAISILHLDSRASGRQELSTENEAKCHQVCSTHKAPTIQRMNENSTSLKGFELVEESSKRVNQCYCVLASKCFLVCAGLHEHCA